MKKYYKLLLAFILCLTLINVNAKSVKINGKSVDIYESGGTESVIFDKDTNTLTLNHYNNGCIYFDGFDNETISIIVKSENTIYSSEYNSTLSAIGLESTSDSTNIEIIGDSSGSYSLELTNYENGILVNGGDISISNVILGIHDIAKYGVYSKSGDIYIKDSTIDSYISGGFAVQGELSVIMTEGGDIDIDNLTYVSLDIYTDIYAIEDLNIKDSNFDIDGSGYALCADYDLNIINTDINIVDSGYLTWCSYLDIKDSDITFDDTDYILYTYYDILRFVKH